MWRQCRDVCRGICRKYAGKGRWTGRLIMRMGSVHWTSFRGQGIAGYFTKDQYCLSEKSWYIVLNDVSCFIATDPGPVQTDNWPSYLQKQLSSLAPKAGFPLKDVGPYLRDGYRDNVYGDWFWSTGVLFPAIIVTFFFTFSPISALGPTNP